MNTFIKSSAVRVSFVAGIVLLGTAAPGISAPADDWLTQGFLQPPPSAYPSGNASSLAKPDALKAQLERQKAFGITHGSIGGTFPPGYMTPAWKESLANTFAAIGAMGFTTGFNISPGFSMTGDFFVQPQDAMKKLVWTRTTVQGGKRFSGRLAAPPTNSGPYLTIPYSNETPWTDSHEKDFYNDVMVLAYKVPATTPLPSAKVTSSSGPVDAARLSVLSTENLVQVAERNGPAWLQFDYSEPQTLRSATLATREMRIEEAIYAELEAQGDDGQFRRVAIVDLIDSSHVTVSFAPVRSKSFRFVFKRQGSPLYRDLIPPPPNDTERPTSNNNPFGAKGTADVYPIALAELHADGGVHEFERKAGFFPYTYDYYALSTPPDAVNAVTSKADVIDITSRMRPDGSINWTPPAGRWEILRLGYSLLGKINHPAAPDATGLEADKLSATHMTSYLERFFAGVVPSGPERKFITTVFTDSTETGPQNWTEDMLAEFRKRRGYDALPYLPALTGVVIDSPAITDKFLWDYRQTIADLTHENTFAKITEVAHKFGIQTIDEALEQDRHQLGDDFEMRRYADIPAGAMWAGTGRVDYLKDMPNQVADLRGAASVAHVYGRERVASESGTNLSNPNAFDPRNMKPMVDLEFAIGVNWMMRGPPPPNETWSAYSQDWVNYLTRSSYMLQQGRYVADVAYFYGQDAPLVTQRERVADAPGRYGYDYINAEALMKAVRVENHRMITSGGMEYRALQLGGQSQMMTLPVLHRLRELVQAGLVVAGKAPVDTPSLADDAAEFARLRTELWGPDGRGAQLGQGRVYGVGSIEEALAAEGIAPDIAASGLKVGSDLLFLHRRVSDGEVYYVVNNADAARSTELSFRVTGKAPELWRADTVERKPLSYRTESGRTIVSVDLRPNDAAFIVFRQAGGPVRTVPAPKSEIVARVDGPWQVSFPANRGAPAQPVSLVAGSWTQSGDAGVKYFSGTATYSRTLQVPAAALRGGGQIMLSLGDVRDIAEVSVNGKSVGTRWTPPYDVDITGAVRSGANQIDVKVTNLWINRMIGDRQPGAQPVARPMGIGGAQTYKADAPPRPSGLIGPVTLVKERP